MSTDERAGLSEGDREVLGEAYRGPWGRNHKTPDRLVAAVERILADRLAAVVAERDEWERIARTSWAREDGTTAVLLATIAERDAAVARAEAAEAQVGAARDWARDWLDTWDNEDRPTTHDLRAALAAPVSADYPE